VIDREPYVAALAQAKAGLAQSEAALVQSQRDLERAESLSKLDAVSEQELDAAVAKNKATRPPSRRPRVGPAAELNLGYTPSPADRRCGGRRSCAGRYGHRQQHPADHDLPDRSHVCEFQHQRTAHAAVPARARTCAQPGCQQTAAVRLFLADGSLYPQIPKLNFIDPAVDTRTGTLAMRWRSTTRSSCCTPASSRACSVAAAGSECDRAAAARGAGPAGQNYVWIVDADSKAQQREVHMGLRLGGDWQVQQGLKPATW